MKYPKMEDGDRHSSLFISTEFSKIFKNIKKEGYAKKSVFMTYLISDKKLSGCSWDGESSTYINGSFWGDYFGEKLIIETFEILKSEGCLSSYSISKDGLISISIIHRNRFVMTESEYSEYIEEE